MKKYAAVSGLGEYVVISNNKAKLVKACKEFAKHDFELLVETCEYLEEEVTMKLEEFFFHDDIEKCDEALLEMLYNNGIEVVHEV